MSANKRKSSRDHQAKSSAQFVEQACRKVACPLLGPMHWLPVRDECEECKSTKSTKGRCEKCKAAARKEWRDCWQQVVAELTEANATDLRIYAAEWKRGEEETGDGRRIIATNVVQLRRRTWVDYRQFLSLGDGRIDALVYECSTPKDLARWLAALDSEQFSTPLLIEADLPGFEQQAPAESPDYAEEIARVLQWDDMQLQLRFGPAWRLVRNLADIEKKLLVESTPEQHSERQKLIQFLWEQHPDRAQQLGAPPAPHEATAEPAATEQRKLKQIYPGNSRDAVLMRTIANRYLNEHPFPSQATMVEWLQSKTQPLPGNLARHGFTDWRAAFSRRPDLVRRFLSGITGELRQHGYTVGRSQRSRRPNLRPAHG